MSIFLKNDKLTIVSELILGGLFAIGVFGIPYFNIPIWLAIPIGLFSIVSGGILMFSGRASALGIKPFSSDPLGWRTAKKSYDDHESK